MNLILFNFDRNIDKCRPSLANYFLFFGLKSQKMRYLHCVVKFQLRELDCALTWYKKLPISGRVDRASATETVDSGSIPGWVKPKTIRIGIHSFSA